MDAFHSLEQQKQQRIINAALNEFARRGFRDASTNAITQQAGISKGALFHYFGNKQKLYAYLMDHTRQQVQTQLLDDFPGSDDLIEMFVLFSKRKAMLAKDYPLMFDFWYKAFQEQQENPHDSQMIRQTIDRLNTLMSDRIDTSKLRPGIDLPKAIEICTWLSEGYGRKYSQMNQQLDRDELLTEADELFDTLRLMLYKEDL